MAFFNFPLSFGGRNTTQKAQTKTKGLAVRAVFGGVFASAALLGMLCRHLLD